jgi:hypothetical protein
MIRVPYQFKDTQARAAIWAIRCCATVTISVIGVTQYWLGDGLVGHVALGQHFHAILSRDRDWFDFRISTQPRDDSTSPHSPDGTTGLANLKGPSPAAPLAPSGVQEAEYTAVTPTFCSVFFLIPKSKAVAGIQRVSFGSQTGDAIEGYGVENILVPDHPSHALPVLEWIRSQGGVSGLRHAISRPMPSGTQLPSMQSSRDDSGAEGDFLVGVAHGAVDLLLVGGGDFASELNPWYHSLNAGFRTQIHRPTACDEKAAGSVESSAREDKKAPGRIDRLQIPYVSDGNSELTEFKVNGFEPDRTVGAEVKLAAGGIVKVTATMLAHLSPDSEQPATRALSQPTAWNIKNARIGMTDTVAVELLANGKVVGSLPIKANGSDQTVSFDVPIESSSWLAIRMMGAGHSNPVYVIVDSKPIRASRSSVEWSMRTVLRDFEAKSNAWSTRDAPQARAAYEFAYSTYAKIMSETTSP